VDRRFQVKGEAAVPGGTVLVVDDYAHHPTEVAATLAAAAKGWPERRVVAVFQPHLYTRTRDLADDFARAFYDADVLVLTDIYGAREEPIEGVDGQLLVDLARRYGHRDVHYVAEKAELPAYLVGLTRPGDLVVTMGAGDVWRYGARFLDALTSREER
jgi:UDP-N-acetylmuramate--alanine ligase